MAAHILWPLLDRFTKVQRVLGKVPDRPPSSLAASTLCSAALGAVTKGLCEGFYRL